MNKFIAILFSSLLLACGSDNSNQKIKVEVKDNRTEQQKSGQKKETIIILDAHQEEFATIKIRNSGPQIFERKAAYTTKNQNGKRKYSNANGLLYTVKKKDNGFKIYDPSDQLKLKVKIKASKIELADNDQMENSLMFKLYDSKVKIKQNDEEVAVAELNKDGNTIYVPGTDGELTLKSSKLNYSSVALAFPGLPTSGQLVLMAELMERGL